VFDLVLCNPPYIATGEVLPRDVADWEPAAALFAGTDGLDDYHRLAPLIGPYLAPCGVACVEIGSTQSGAVTALFAAEGLTVALARDLAGLPRCLTVTK
jgi:release factor glutamine methyltransferase